MSAGVATCPPRVTPPARPLRFPLNLVQLLSNNLAIVPERAYHDSVVIANGPPRFAFITGADAVEEILKARAAEFPKGQLQNEVLEPLFGDAMISAHGEAWRWQRSVAAPLFRHEQILNYVSIMYEAAQAMVTVWRATPVEYRALNRDMMHVTFGVISKTMLVGGAEPVIKAIEVGHAEYFRQVNWWVLTRALRLPRWFPHPGWRAMRRQELRLRQSVESLVRERLAYGEGGRDLLGLLLAAQHPETGRQMSKALIVNNIIAFLVAGYDTTALALTWALYLIASHPGWGEQIRAEAEAAAGDGPLGPEHLSALVVTEQVLNEALRLYPTAPVIVRDVLEDVLIDGVRIAKGTICIVPIYAVHRHHAFWRDPDRFDPTRFAPNTAAKPGRFHFLPFGAGPRICIGNAFAMIEGKIMLAAFLRAVRFELQPGFVPRPTGQMFLTANGDVPMRIIPRT